MYNQQLYTSGLRGLFSNLGALRGRAGRVLGSHLLPPAYIQGQTNVKPGLLAGAPTVVSPAIVDTSPRSQMFSRFMNNPFGASLASGIGSGFGSSAGYMLASNLFNPSTGLGYGVGPQEAGSPPAVDTQQIQQVVQNPVEVSVPANIVPANIVPANIVPVPVKRKKKRKRIKSRRKKIKIGL